MNFSLVFEFFFIAIVFSLPRLLNFKRSLLNDRMYAFLGPRPPACASFFSGVYNFETKTLTQNVNYSLLTNFFALSESPKAYFGVIGTFKGLLIFVTSLIRHTTKRENIKGY